MGLRTASVRRLSSETMAPALTETKTGNSFKLTHSTCDQAAVVDAAAAVFDDTIAHTNTQTAIVRKGVKGDAAFDLAHFQLAAELLKNDITFERCKQPPADYDIMNNTDSDTIHNTNMGLQQQIHMKDEKIEGQIVEQMFGNLPALHTDDDLMQQVIKSIESSVTGEDELPLTASDLATLPGNLSSLEKALFNAVDMISISMVEEQLMCNSVTATSNDVDTKHVRTKELITQVQGKQARLERKLDFLVRRLRKMQMRYMGQHVSAEVAGVYEHVHRTLRRLKEQGNNAAMAEASASAALDLSVTSALAGTSYGPLDVETAATLAPAAAETLKPISHGAAKSLVKKLENTRYLQANSAARQRHSARFFGSGSIEPTSFRNTSATTPSSSAASMTTLPTWPAADKTSLQQTAGQLRAQFSLVQGQLDSDATLSSSGGESCDEMQTYGNVHQQYLAIQKRAAWKYSAGRASIAARWSWLLAQIADLEYRIRQHTDLQRQMRTRKGPVTLTTAVVKPTTSATNAAVNGYRGTLPGDNNKTVVDVAAVTDNCGNQQQSASDQQTTTFTPTTSASCARIRPLNTSAFTKRRLVQTGGLHVVSKKAARPATVRCTCIADVIRDCSTSASATVPASNDWKSLMNCAVCTGRSDATHPRDPTEHLSRMERIALLDGGYHPVVSLPEDTSISVHMEAIMKSVDWQQRSSRSSLKAMKYAIKADRLNNDREKQQQQQQQSGSGGEQRERSSGKKSGSGLEHRKKYSRMSSTGSIKGTTVNALTAKLKSGRPRGRKPNRHNNNSLSHNKKHRRHSHHHPQQQQQQQQQQRTREHSATYLSHYNSNDDMDDDDYTLLDDPDYLPIIGDQYVVDMGGGSRSGSPLLATQSISGFGRRNRVDSYDIDNIVIPYSVAASTRVERLQYKEILTPKWRLIDNGNLPPIKYESKHNGVVKITSQENEVSDVEDITEDAVQQRHDKSEQEEKRKFLSYLKLPFGYYGNSAPAVRRHHHTLQHNNHKRTDSRAESSGANTPDNPMSPAAANAVQHGGETAVETPVASPPNMDQLGNKGSVADDLPEALRNLPLSSLSSLRRRTISASSSRWLQRDSTSNDGSSSDQQQLAPIIEIPPFDRRQFPLSEENYDKMVRGMPEGHHKGTDNQPLMNVRNQDNSSDGIASSSLTTTSMIPMTPHQATPTTTTTTATIATTASPDHQQRRRRSNQQHHQQQVEIIDHCRSRGILDDIDSESTESAFGDDDPNDPEWDMEEQIACSGGRNSYHGELGRYRR